MEIRHYKALWGMTEPTLDDQLKRIKAAGFDGFENPVMPHNEVKAACEKHDLGYIAMLFVEDAENLKKGLGEAYDGGADKVTVHAGRCYWPYEQGAKFFEEALKVVEGHPFEVNFETHRGRLLFEPQSTARYLKDFPTLHLCADLSHWTCVCESMLGEQKEAMDGMTKRTRHIHARVGHEEGPQVPDPRKPQWEGHVKRFEQMWDAIRAAHVERGAKMMTVDPEFGPPNYLWTNPADGKPLADLFDVCAWMKDRLKERWKTV